MRIFRTLNSDEYYSLVQAAKELGMSHQTLWRYYDWWGNPNFEKPNDPELQLPKICYFGHRRTAYIRKSDLCLIKKFKELLNEKYRGIMGEYNSIASWGKIGEQILKRRGKDYMYEKNKLNYMCE